MIRTAPASNKYELKSLHEQIDLYDRKLAHLDKYAANGPEADRAKLVTKRNTLEATARRLAAEGIEFDPKDLPRSFRAAQTEGAAEAQELHVS